MNNNQLLLSDQMREVLGLLDRQSPMTARQLNRYMYALRPHRSRRVFAASISRTVRRLGRRGLISREGSTIAITQTGMFRLHPEMLEEMLTELGKSVRQAVAEAWASYEQSQKPNAEVRNDAASDRPAPDRV